MERVKDDATRFAKYRDDPVGFARDVLGLPVFEQHGTGIWRKQREILEAVRDHRLVTVRSGHGTGKTHSLAILVLWWLYGRQGTVVTTASGWEQVRTVLWRQIHLLLHQAKVYLPRLPEHPLQTELAITETWKAFGRSVDNPTAFQGIHDPRLLVVIDEAPGIKAEVHRALRSLVTGRENRLIMIGNPVEYGGAFWESHQPESRFHQIHVDCYDHPNLVEQRELIPGAVTQEWVHEQAEEHGEGSPEFLARVRGEFPTEGTSAVFSQRVVDRAMDEARYAEAREQALQGKDPVVFALDVARFGKNKTVLVERRGGVIVSMEAWQGHDATVTQDRVVALIGSVRDSGAPIGALVVDETGLGGPVLDHLRRAMPWCTMVGFNGGRAARDGIYANRRSEAYLRVRRTWFDQDAVRLPYHRQLRADLLAPTYGFNATSKLQVERKEQLERRGVESPDYGDAVLMAFVNDWTQDAPQLVEPTRDQDPSILEELVPKDEGENPFEALPGWA